MKTINELKGMFFTSDEEMIEVFNENNYDVIDLNCDYMIVMDITESDNEEIEINLVRAGKTIGLR